MNLLKRLREGREKRIREYQNKQGYNIAQLDHMKRSADQEAKRAAVQAKTEARIAAAQSRKSEGEEFLRVCKKLREMGHDTIAMSPEQIRTVYGEALR